jgi:hypothetical protein
LPTEEAGEFVADGYNFKDSSMSWNSKRSVIFLTYPSTILPSDRRAIGAVPLT